MTFILCALSVFVGYLIGILTMLYKLGGKK